MYSEWEDEIAAKNMERTLSIVFQVSKAAQDDMEKSIADDIGYSQEFQIEKTGKEIKEKLQTELTTITADKVMQLAKMELLVKEVGQMPAGHTEQWEIRGYEKYLGVVPMKYAYAQIYPDKKQSTGGYPEDSWSPGSENGITPEITKDVADKMRAYNDAASNYIRSSIEEVKLKTVIDNLADAKKIKLTPPLATQLGF